jgi:hypothetical protein
MVKGNVALPDHILKLYSIRKQLTLSFQYIVEI